MRINKFLAHAGVCSRRDAEKLISAGQISINGEKVTNLATTVIPGTDYVTYKGVSVDLETKEEFYIVLNKPLGKTCTTNLKDPLSVLHMLPKELHNKAWSIVGRLDKNSEGLVFMTTDKPLVEAIGAPKNKQPKTYTVTAKGKVTSEDIDTLQKGVQITIDEKKTYTTKPCKISEVRDKKTTTQFNITLFEGKKRQIRLMTKALGYPVTHLKRITLGPIQLKSLPLGEWRNCTSFEEKKLKELI